jgi:tetratricopeptide (TPR) repeat protein
MRLLATSVEFRSGPVMLATAACVATIAHSTVGGTWHPVFGVLIGMLWVLASAAFFYELFLRRRLAHKRHPKLLEEVIASGSPEAAAKASSDLGVLLVGRGDVDGARAAFERAIDSGFTDVIAMAAFNLGLLEHSSGNLKAAIPAYRRAIDSGHPEFRPMSANNLGQIFQLLGRCEQARAAYKIAASSEDKKQVKFASRALAKLGADGPAQPGHRPP